jgi:peptide deformylase
LQIIAYPHPTLRHKSKPLRRVDDELRKIIAEMFELMYQADGIGLAANQVDLPLQLFVVNTSGKKGGGEELVFINPVLSKHKGNEAADEGCLSLPGIHEQVIRPKQVDINAYDLSGNEINATLDGLMARVVQHEFDHLHGVLFIDRISDSSKVNIAELLEEFEIDFDSHRRAGQIPSDEQIAARLKEIEATYT